MSDVILTFIKLIDLLLTAMGTALTCAPHDKPPPASPPSSS